MDRAEARRSADGPWKPGPPLELLLLFDLVELLADDTYPEELDVGPLEPNLIPDGMDMELD